MTLPLVHIGPGGPFSTSYLPRGSRLLALEGGVNELGQAEAGVGEDTGSGSGQRFWARDRAAASVVAEAQGARPVTLLDRLLGIDRVEGRRSSRCQSPLADAIPSPGSPRRLFRRRHSAFRCPV